MLVTELDLPEFDYLDPELRGDRYHDAVRELRERSWLARSPLAYVVLERESASFFLRTRSATFPGKQLAELFEITEGALAEEVQRNILHRDGADHRRLRNLVAPAFTPRAADRWRPAMRGFLDELLAAVPAGGRCDFVEAFAKPYPALTIATLMGAPLSDAPRLHEWSNWIQKQFDAPTLLSQRARIERAAQELYVWAHELLARRRAEGPGDDLISALIAAEAEGDRLDDVELVNLVVNVLAGGVDTTQSQLCHAVRLLAEHPAQWELLRSDPERYVPLAVEEVLRYEPITPFTARIMLEDVEHRDVTFPAGTIVLVGAVTANREGVEEGETFDITADRGSAKPLTFGAGPHFCLGANLARAELQEALGCFARRVDRIALDGEPAFDTINRHLRPRGASRRVRPRGSARRRLDRAPRARLTRRLPSWRAVALPDRCVPRGDFPASSCSCSSPSCSRLPAARPARSAPRRASALLRLPVASCARRAARSPVAARAAEGSTDGNGGWVGSQALRP